MSALSHILAYSLAALSYAIGGAGLAAFGVFLAIGPPVRVDLGLPPAEALVLNALLSAAFFLQHSGMVRSHWQRFLATRVPPEYVPAVYSVASGAVLLAVVLLWQEVGEPVVAARGWARWAVRGCWLAGGAIMLWSWRALDSLDALGVEPIFRRLRRQEPIAACFRVAGPYRWVRHPMYLASLLLIWGYPSPTADRLLFSGLWSLWVVVGARFEEGDLVQVFGQQYRAYQRRVPMLLPHRRPAGDDELARGVTLEGGGT